MEEFRISYEDSVKILEKYQKCWPFARISDKEIKELRQAYLVVERAKLEESPL